QASLDPGEESGPEQAEETEEGSEPEEIPAEAPAPAPARPALADLTFAEAPLGIAGIPASQEVTAVDPIGPYLITYDDEWGKHRVLRVEGSRAIEVEMPEGRDYGASGVLDGVVYFSDAPYHPPAVWDIESGTTTEISPPGGPWLIPSIAPIDADRMVLTLENESDSAVALMEGDDIVWKVSLYDFVSSVDDRPLVRAAGDRSWVIVEVAYSDVVAINVETGQTVDLAHGHVVGAYPEGIVVKYATEGDELAVLDPSGTKLQSATGDDALFFGPTHLQQLVSFADLNAAVEKLARGEVPYRPNDNFGYYTVAPGGDVVAEYVLGVQSSIIGDHYFECDGYSLILHNTHRILCSSHAGLAAFDIPTEPLSAAEDVFAHELPAFADANSGEQAQMWVYGAVPDWEIPSAKKIDSFQPFDGDTWVMVAHRPYILR
ncbi:MAG: hypothetical protein Q4P33_07610, partial [Flaviflexus sp.]|nr:hypothetical protein [Flaviflexus sp.]